MFSSNNGQHNYNNLTDVYKSLCQTSIFDISLYVSLSLRDNRILTNLTFWRERIGVIMLELRLPGSGKKERRIKEGLTWRRLINDCPLH